MQTTMIRRTNRPAAGRKAVARTRQAAQNAARRIRRLMSAAFAALLLAVGQATQTFAQGGGGGDGGTGAFGERMTALATNLATLGRPLAAVAVTIALLTTVFEPALPDMARENKGVIRRVLLACIVLGLIPDLLGFVFA